MRSSIRGTRTTRKCRGHPAAAQAGGSFSTTTTLSWRVTVTSRRSRGPTSRSRSTANGSPTVGYYPSRYFPEDGSLLGIHLSGVVRGLPRPVSDPRRGARLVGGRVSSRRGGSELCDRLLAGQDSLNRLPLELRAEKPPSADVRPWGLLQHLTSPG